MRFFVGMINAIGFAVQSPLNLLGRGRYRGEGGGISSKRHLLEGRHEVAKVWSFETQKADIGNGYIPALGWEQFGGESVPAVAGVVYRLLARRSAGARSGRTVESVSWGVCEGIHMAGTCGDLMGLAGRGLA